MTPTPPRDLREYDRDGIAGTIHTPDPAAVERLRALMAQQAAQQPRTAEAGKRQHNGDHIVANLQRAAIAHADRVRFVLSDEQLADVERRRAAGESWESIATPYGRSHTTLWAAVMRQRAAKKAAKENHNERRPGSFPFRIPIRLRRLCRREPAAAAGVEPDAAQRPPLRQRAAALPA